MSTLRTLSVIYLLCASAFSVAIAFDRDPPLERASRAAVGRTIATLENYVVRPGFRLARDGGNRLIAAYNDYTTPKKTLAVTTKPSAAPVPQRPAPSIQPAPKPLLARAPQPGATPLPPAMVPDVHVAEAAPPANVEPVTPRHKPRLALEPPPSLPPSPATVRGSLGRAELARVSLRLKENLTHEMLNNFSLFLYVSKADKGPWAQRLYVFRKDARGDLALLYNWAASTGREKRELAPNGTRQHTITPRGYYELDPARMFPTHYSGQWREPMPYAMFFNWENHGYLTGLAIHAATQSEITQLGSRASAGCIRIAPENAQLLFGLIRAQYKGLAPRFAYNQRTATMSNDGMLMHDAAGNLKMAEGYKVLVFIENYGGENVVAALF
jgi:lipoprotein-anchoring transpeptidase ErfK/SrfK